MNRIDQKFIQLKRQGKPAFMPFIVGGDPNFHASLQIAKSLCQTADLLEIGFPYSDPLADGPTIQAADMRALRSGATTDSVFKLIAEIRKLYQTPITVLVYANLVLQRGVEKFYHDAAVSGIDGVLIPDVPVEEVEEFVKAAKKYKIHQIFLVTQMTDNERLKKILQHTQGFLYLVSILGVTGARKSFDTQTKEFIRRIRKQTSLPLCVGFGVSTPKQFSQMVEAGANGVIIGSAIIDIILKNHRPPFHKLTSFVRQFSMPAKVKVKICGIKTKSAALIAAKYGADFLGFNFVPTSKRLISPITAQEIINSLPDNNRPTTVGIFMNQNSSAIKKVLSKVKVDMLQFHGKETPEFCHKFATPFIKAFAVDSKTSVPYLSGEMKKYKADYFLLDRPQQGQGQPIDLKKVKELAQKFPVILAGGLNPKNVKTSIQKSSSIEGVDVAGGVETHTTKNPNKIKAFIHYAKSYLNNKR